MQLLSIETHNFKKLRHFQATFTDGLNVIVGDNAQGKSTLLQAIECALYGAGVVPGKKEHIITWGQKTWRVVLAFRFAGEEYWLTRSKSTAKLERVIEGADEGELVANGHTPVSEAVAALLDLSARDYNLFMQSKQGETTGILTFGAAALSRKVEAFSGISLIDRVQSLAQEQFRTLKAEAEARVVTPEALEAAQADHTARTDNVHVAEADREAAQVALAALPELDALPAPEADPDALQRQRDRVNQLRGRHERADQELKHAEQRYQEALQRFEEVARPAEAEALAGELNAVRREVKTRLAEVAALDEQLVGYRHTYERLVKAELAMDQDPSDDELDEAVAQAVDAVEHAEASAQALTQREHELAYRLQQLTELREGAECPTCGTQLSEHDPVKLDAERAELVAQREALKAQRDAADTQYRTLEGQRRAAEAAREQARAHEALVDQLRDDFYRYPETLQRQRDAAHEQHQVAVGQAARLEAQVEQLEAQWQQYRRLERAVAAARTSRDDARGEREALTRELAEAEAKGVPNEQDIEQARQAWRRYEDERGALRVQRLEAQHRLEAADTALRHARQALEQAEARLAELQRRAAEAAQAARDADQAARLARFLGERRAGYLQEVWDAVLGAASRQVALASKSMLTRLVFDDGDFLYEEEGILAPVTSASGAQKAHIGVALRIGLARALYGSDALLIFDEPSESMSEHHAAGLSASLAGAAAQCLLITHREQDQDLAANVIEVAA